MYQGFMQKEKPHGKGRLINLDIYYCEGDWANGKLNGQGKFVNFQTKEEYEGEYKDGLFHGQGIHTNIFLEKYEGGFENN